MCGGGGGGRYLCSPLSVALYCYLCFILIKTNNTDLNYSRLSIPPSFHPSQVRDTVDLWRLPNQRKISLRFLASYVLQEDIQDEIHDSIEDAKTALLLYRRYEDMLAEKGPAHIHAFLQQLYQYGNRTNWTIGIDRLQQQQQQR